jgi:ubiquinone/menaquinone biosynthesis C-methylase UbiE
MTATPEDAKDRNRAQFGANAGNYADSIVHAKGASLARMVELVEPQSEWRALDIATAAGHTALAFASHVSHVTATDLTPEMVALCAKRSAELAFTNVETQLADAEALPFEDDSFDLATCRIAPHHFPNPAMFISEVARVLVPGGTFAMVDNVVPDNPDVALFCDDWERRRDPSHVGCLSMAEWSRLMADSGMVVRVAETAPKRMGFQMWVDNMNVADADRPRLLTDLLDATPAVVEFLRPEGSTQADAAFTLTEGLFVAST